MIRFQCKCVGWIVFFCLTLCLSFHSVSAQQSTLVWPEFRGPTGDGHADHSRLPVQFGEELENLQWKTAIHGKGWSSPVIWDEQIWLTTATEDGTKMSVICVDLETGKILKDLVVFENANPDFCHPTNSYASPTPAIESGRVYVHFGKYGTACLDTSSGKIIWSRRDFECDHFRGPASSPVLFQDLMVVAFDGADQQYVVALDKSSGETRWKVDRNIEYFKGDDGDWKKAYGTASIFQVDGQPLLVYPSASATVAYRPETGAEVWRVYHDGMNASARPVQTHNGLILITNGMGMLVAVDPGGSGDVTDTHVRWTASKSVARKSSLLVVDDLVYMNDDKGIFSCIDPEDGSYVWQKRLGGTFAASPIHADGKIYAFSGEGKIHVLKPGREFELVSESDLGDGYNASPAVSGNKLILRSYSHLYCIEE